jgi:hypothetical protein
LDDAPCSWKPSYWSAMLAVSLQADANTSLVVIPRDEPLVVVVRCVARIHAVRPVDQLQVVELPVIRVLDVKDAAVSVGEGGIEGCGCSISLASDQYR